MKIERAELRLVRLPLRFRFETSFGVQSERVFPLLTLFSDGLRGSAEGVMDDRWPLYREETVGGAMALLDTLLPTLVGRDFPNPEALERALEPVRGNAMTRAIIEMAFWDLWARSLERPLWHVLGGTRETVEVGVSLGIQANLEATVEAVGEHLALGYRRVKLKIKPGWDLGPLAAVRERYPNATLTVDANSAYTLADAGHLERFDAYGLDYIEQPLAWNDLHDHARLQARLRTALCLDESITSAFEARKALETGACRVVNIKVARVGGHLEARRVHDLARAYGASVWCGGMLESGVGRAHNIHLSTLEHFSKPGDTSSSSRYWSEDIVQEPLEVKDGIMPVPTGHGIGVTLDEARLARVSQTRAVYP
jgi:O-succinylbenzoate synthase